MKKLSKLVFLSLVFMLSAFVNAGTPTCHSSSGGYCQYNGKVDRIYVNNSRLILIYFDTPMPSGAPAVAGYTPSNLGAAAFHIDSNPEFAQYFYSTALAAQASGRDVSIQMRGTQSGYMKFDRIWLSAP